MLNSLEHLILDSSKQELEELLKDLEREYANTSKNSLSFLCVTGYLVKVVKKQLELKHPAKQA